MVLEQGPVREEDRALAVDLYERDKIFADIDYRRFASRDGIVPSLR